MLLSPARVVLWFIPLLILSMVPHAVGAEKAVSGTVEPTMRRRDPPYLMRHTDQALQTGLMNLLRKQGLWQYANNKTLAVGVVDITDLDNPRYAAINPNHMMYAASLPKIAILLGAYHRIHAGDLKLTPELQDKMTRMIRSSSNTAATEVLDLVGRQYLIDLLKSESLRLYDVDYNGGLWVGKPYAKKGAYQRDPLHNLSHGATVYQTLRFFYLLEIGRLVDEKLYRSMKETLSRPAISHKFVAGLRGRREEVKVYRKSGTWRDYHADVALVETRGRRVIMMGIVQNPKGGKWLQKLAAPLLDLVLDSVDDSSKY